jgi:hypothetical protein
MAAFVCFKLFSYVVVCTTLVAALVVFLFEPQRAAHAALPESLRPFRPVPIRVMNAVNLAVSSVFGAVLVKIDSPRLLATACASFNVERGAEADAACNWGDDAWGSSWREGFELLVESMRDDAELTLIGELFATHRLEMVLGQRLRLVAYWERGTATGEAVRAADVAPPLFVVGLPRTGTSFLHSLLSQDTDNFRSALNWMVVDPVPPLFGAVGEGAGAVARDSPASAALRAARIAEAQANLAHFKSIAPGVDAQHAMTAFRPEECIVLFAHSFTAGFEFITCVALRRVASRCVALRSFSARLHDRAQ